MRRPRTYLVALGVHLDGADNQVARFALVDRHAGPPELRPDPRDQLPHGERLGDIVVRPDLQARHLVGLGVLGGQDDDRDLGLPPDDPAQVEPVDVRQHEVEDHQHGASLPEQIETPEPVQCGDGVEALPLELVADGADESLLVLHHQDGPYGRRGLGRPLLDVNVHRGPRQAPPRWSGPPCSPP